MKIKIHECWINNQMKKSIFDALDRDRIFESRGEGEKMHKI